MWAWGEGGRGGGAWRSHLMFNVQRSNELMTSSLDRGNGLHLRGGWFGDASAATRTGELRRQPIKPHSVTVAAIVVCTRRAASCASHSYGQSREGWVQARAWEARAWGHIRTHTERHTELGWGTCETQNEASLSWCAVCKRERTTRWAPGCPTRRARSPGSQSRSWWWRTR
jgi:hypothetical protein